MELAPYDNGFRKRSLLELQDAYGRLQELVELTINIGNVNYTTVSNGVSFIRF